MYNRRQLCVESENEKILPKMSVREMFSNWYEKGLDPNGRGEDYETTKSS